MSDKHRDCPRCGCAASFSPAGTAGCPGAYIWQCSCCTHRGIPDEDRTVLDAYMARPPAEQRAARLAEYERLGVATDELREALGPKDEP